MIQTAVLIASLALQSTPQALPSFTEKLPKGLAEFKMITVPDGTITIDGKTHEIKKLSVSETEVTWDIYDVFFLGKDLTEEEQAKRADAENRPSRPYGLYDRGFGHNGYPAIGMHYPAALKFCEWLSKQTGKKYRLPTPAEWQYLASAGQPMPDLEKAAWFWDNSDDSTHAVKSKAPNAWGIYDVLGNASEWVASPDGEPPLTMGGSWKDKAEVVNFTTRVPYSPAWQDRDAQLPKSKWWLSDGPFVGFRVVCEGN